MLPTSEQIVHRAAEAALARMVLAAGMAAPVVSRSELCETVAAALRARTSGWVRTEHRVQMQDTPSGRGRVPVAMLHQGQITFITMCDDTHAYDAQSKQLRNMRALQSDGFPTADIAYVMVIGTAQAAADDRNVQTFRYTSPFIDCAITVVAVQRAAP